MSGRRETIFRAGAGGGGVGGDAKETSDEEKSIEVTRGVRRSSVGRSEGALMEKREGKQ